jgi:hypothetical protein
MNKPEVETMIRCRFHVHDTKLARRAQPDSNAVVCAALRHLIIVSRYDERAQPDSGATLRLPQWNKDEGEDKYEEDPTEELAHIVDQARHPAAKKENRRSTQDGKPEILGEIAGCSKEIP